MRKKFDLQLKEDLFLSHTWSLRMLSDKLHIYALSQQRRRWQAEQAGDLQEGCHLPSHQHRCLQLSRHGNLPQAHSTVGQDVCGINATLPSPLHDGAGAWRAIFLFSASWEGLPSEGKLHQEGRVTTGDMGNHPAHGATPKSHLEETREQKSTGWEPGASSELQGCRESDPTTAFPGEGFARSRTVSGAAIVLLEEMIHAAPACCRARPLTRGRHPPTSAFGPSLWGAPMGSDGTERRLWLPQEEQFLSKLLILPS